jgi:DnaJ family protein B protein 4
MGSKDYYALLGVHHLASDDEIKRAYKQKALKHHPDKNRDDIDAEKKFMDISEAYEMLSDPYKRSLYDRFGSEELRNYLGTDPRTNFRSTGTNYSNSGTDDYTYDPYNNYFVRYKDPTIFHDLYVTLEEVFKGATKKMKITRKRFNAELNTTVRDEKLLEIQIKPGWKEGTEKTAENLSINFDFCFYLGTKITFEGEGDECDSNTIAGDIVFIIRDKAHPIFERSNSDLIYRVKLTIKQALLGSLIVIPFLDSARAPYQIRSHQEIIAPQTEKRFLNEGLPYPKDPTRRGDLIVKFDILFPSGLNNEQRTLVDCCFSNSIEFYQPHDSVLNSTVIEQTQQQQRRQTSPTRQPPPSPSQQQTVNPNSTSTATLKPQSAPPTPNINNNINQQKAPTRQVNGNGHAKSPSSPVRNPNKIKLSPVRTSTSVLPSAPPSSPATVLLVDSHF